MKNIHIILYFIAIFSQVALSYDFCKDNKDLLTKYNIYKQFSGEDPNRKLSAENDIPTFSYEKTLNDNKITQSWIVNVCGNEIDSSSNNKIDLSKYTKNSLFYAATKIESGDIYTEVINILNTDLNNDNLILNELNDAFTGLNVLIKNQKNNNFNITFQCDNNLKIDEFSKIDKQESFDINLKEDFINWSINLRGPSGCLTNNRDNKPVQPPMHAQSHSFFLYFVIYVLIFTCIYIGATSYLEVKDGGTLQDFEDTFKYKFKELVFAIPAFSKELYNKLMGNSSSRYNPVQYNNNGNGQNTDNRGGYAAV